MRFSTVAGLAGLVVSGLAVAGAPGPDYFSPDPPLSARDKKQLVPAEQWINSATYPIRKHQRVTYLYGSGQATVICAPLRLCMVSLEPGEWVQPNGLHLGDAVRWEVNPVIGADEQTQLVIKVVDAGLETNLSVITDRRTYHLRLISKRKQYMPKVAFHYPEILQARWQDYHERRKKERERNTLSTDGKYIFDLDFAYRLDGCRKCEWFPSRVYNDGETTIIQFGTDAQNSDLPVLLVLDPAGQQMHVNYRVHGDRYIVDQVFYEALLLVGTGKHQRRVRIRREG